MAEDWRCFCTLAMLSRFFSSVTSLLSERSEITEGAPVRVSNCCAWDARPVVRLGVSLSLLFSGFFSFGSCPFFAPGPPGCWAPRRFPFWFPLKKHRETMSKNLRKWRHKQSKIPQDADIKLWALGSQSGGAQEFRKEFCVSKIFGSILKWNLRL